MKNFNKNIENEISQILMSGANKEQVKTSPFFTTQVLGKVEQLNDKPEWFTRLVLIAKPVMVALILVNIFNLYIYFQNLDSNTLTEDTIELATNDYEMWNSDFILSDELVFVN